MSDVTEQNTDIAFKMLQMGKSARAAAAELACADEAMKNHALLAAAENIEAFSP